MLQVVFVVVPLHGLSLHRYLSRGFAHRGVRRQSADTQALHPEALALLSGAGDREHAHSSAAGKKKKKSSRENLPWLEAVIELTW